MFLTVVTRCCRRPQSLSENIASIEMQTDHDVEQIFIVDRQRKGMKEANQSLALNADRVDGDYVYILDDDCIVIDPYFVEKVKEVAGDDVIMVKSMRPPGPPSRQSLVPTVWEGTLRHGTCNCLCYVVRSGLWKEYIERYGTKCGGDWAFLRRVLGAKPAMYWLDEIVADARQLGRGKLFETAEDGWFERVAEEHNLENLGEGDWRLRLWMRD